MYKIEVEIEGTSPLLQHKFGAITQQEMESPSKKRTGVPDYSKEWEDTCYVENDHLVQPGLHIEMAMAKASKGYKMPGSRGKSYYELFASNVFVKPEMIPHGVRLPKTPNINVYEDRVYVDVRAVVVNRGRVLRSRLALAPGWRLAFQIDVEDDQLQVEVVKEVLEQAGQKVGLGDYRPRNGRFKIIKFDKQ
jgi:hypothetical protein